MLERRDALPNFQDISTDQATITDDDRWKTYFLYGFGFRSDANCARCPETARLVAAVPGMQTAMFSILAPGKHIPEHNGPYKGVIRYHLGIKVPRDADALPDPHRRHDHDAGARARASSSTTRTSTRCGTTPTRSGWCSSSTSCGRCASR